jgi:hypothetical protein
MNEDFTELVEFLDKKFENIDKKFEKVENDIKEVRDNLSEFKDDVYKFQDEVLGDLEMLKQEKMMGDDLTKRKTKVLEIHNTALKDAKILSKDQVAQVNNLQVF